MQFGLLIGRIAEKVFCCSFQTDTYSSNSVNPELCALALMQNDINATIVSKCFFIIMYRFVVYRD